MDSISIGLNLETFSIAAEGMDMDESDCDEVIEEVIMSEGDSEGDIVLGIRSGSISPPRRGSLSPSDDPSTNNPAQVQTIPIEESSSDDDALSVASRYSLYDDELLEETLTQRLPLRIRPTPNNNSASNTTTTGAISSTTQDQKDSGSSRNMNQRRRSRTRSRERRLHSRSRSPYLPPSRRRPRIRSRSRSPIQQRRRVGMGRRSRSREREFRDRGGGGGRRSSSREKELSSRTDNSSRGKLYNYGLNILR